MRHLHKNSHRILSLPCFPLLHTCKAKPLGGSVGRKEPDGKRHIYTQRHNENENENENENDSSNETRPAVVLFILAQLLIVQQRSNCFGSLVQVGIAALDSNL
jgi:hypothetical protein